MMFNPRKFVRSFKHASNGIVYTLREHQNLQFDVFAAAVILLLSYYFHITKAELLVVLTSIFFVFFSELINTAIEETCNAITIEHHPTIKVAKDVSAGAVLITSIFAAIVGIIIFVPYIF